MKLFIKNKRVDAVGEYDMKSGVFIVKKGSKVSAEISQSEKFRGATTIEKNREQFAKDGVVVVDATFKSPSTAANFVTGRSTNGLVAWKDKNGVTLKELMTNQNDG